MVEDTEEITNADLLEAFTGFRAEILGRIDGLEKRFDNVDGELEGVRKVIDSEMADLKSMVNVEWRLSKLEAAVDRPARVKR